MDKPYIIIHTHTSIDGNIDIMDLFEFQEASRQYQELAINPEKQQFGIQGYLNGKTTTEDNMTHYKEPKLEKNVPLVPEGDYINNPDAPMYYLSIDARGELAFEENYLSYFGVKSFFVEILNDESFNAFIHFLIDINNSFFIILVIDIT